MSSKPYCGWHAFFVVVVVFSCLTFIMQQNRRIEVMLIVKLDGPFERTIEEMKFENLFTSLGVMQSSINFIYILT